MELWWPLNMKVEEDGEHIHIGVGGELTRIGYFHQWKFDTFGAESILTLANCPFSCFFNAPEHQSTTFSTKNSRPVLIELV
jgi:hypothetical protein